MKIDNRVTFDKICDYIPIASTFNSIVDLWQKHAYQKGLKTDATNLKYWDAYHVKIINKSTARSVFLLVPVLGNICVGLYDLIKLCVKSGKNTAPQSTKTDSEIDAIIQKYGIFGEKQWEELGFVLGSVPPLSDNIENLLDAPDEDGKTRADVYGLVLVPAKVNGEVLTYARFVNSMSHAFAFPLTEERTMQYHLIAESLRHPPIGERSGKSFWSLLEKKSYFPDDDSF